MFALHTHVPSLPRLGSSSTTLKFRFRGVSMLTMCPFATAESQNHPEQMKWEGTSASHLGHLPCSSRGSWSRVPRTVSSRLLNISKGGDCTTSLSNLFQCSITLMVKKDFLIFKQDVLYFNLCPLSLVSSP